MPRRGLSKPKEQTQIARSPGFPCECHIVVMFVDIVGSSEISNNKTLEDYYDFLGQFRDCFLKVCDHYKKLEYEEHERPFFHREVRGDEGCVKIFVPGPSFSSVASNIKTAISIALDLKREWLLTKFNRQRIRKDQLLPIEIAIGIHAGKVWVTKEGSVEYRPEGYAINLAKRIEGEARNGKFTHILLSEATRGLLHNLTDEPTFLLDAPYPFRPKGISREIKVYEIKHHFLATDWTDWAAWSSIVYKSLDYDMVETAREAYEASPTNLWLAEEYLMLYVMYAWKKLPAAKREDTKELNQTYKPAIQTVRQIANAGMRDPGLLALWGFIAGEQKDYKEEQRRYKEAIELDPLYGEAYWYFAYSMSQQLKESIKGKPAYGELGTAHQKIVDEILKTYEKACDLRPMAGWIAFDYACELSRWASETGPASLPTAEKELLLAFSLNPHTKERSPREDYLKPVLERAAVKKVLGKSS